MTNPDTGGFVSSLSRPGGNITGISNPDVSILRDRIKLLKELAPTITRLLVLFDPNHPNVPNSLRMIATITVALGVHVSSVGVHDIAGIEQAIGDFARIPNGGLLVIQSSIFTTKREWIALLAAQHNLPGVFHLRAFAASGGLASLGIDQLAAYAQAPAFLDRILKGEKAADLPVQEPSKSELVINLKVAKQLGLETSIRSLTAQIT